MIRGLWDHQVESIIDAKLGNNDTDSYKYEPMAALLSRWERIKNYKHGKQYHDQRIFFAVFSLSGRNAREGIPGFTITIELSHGIKKG